MSSGVALAVAPRSAVTARDLAASVGRLAPREHLEPLDLPLTPTRRELDHLATSRELAAVALVASSVDAPARELRRSPPVAPALRVFFLPEGAGEDSGALVDKTVRELAGWAAGTARRPPIGSQHLRTRLRLDEGAVSRRELWATIAGIEHEVIPAVDPRRCVGSSRCGLCVGSCPARAIDLRGGRAVVDPRRCTGCGGCVAACPVDAIRFPGATKEELDAVLATMLAGELAGPVSPIVALTCARWPGLLPPPYLECPLPCVGSLFPWIILRALDLGAAGVLVVASDSPCREAHRQTTVEQQVEATRQILGALGAEPERVTMLDAARPEGLAAFSARVTRLGAHRWPRGSDSPPPLTLGGLVARMAGTSDGATVEYGSGQAPAFASVGVDAARCSLCGLCALCPSGAITQRDAEERRELYFHYRACTGCGVCQKLCPEKAVRLTRVLAPKRLREAPRVLVRGELTRCERCGTPIAPAPMLAAVRRRVAARHGSLQVLDGIARLCPACRLFPESTPGIIVAGRDR